MDVHNRYHTPSTWRLVRLEHLALLGALVTLTALHAHEVRWGRFVLAFVLIDLVGYLPGALAQRRAGEAPIAPRYHHLYNVAHSFLTAGLVVALWALAIGGLEWAMTALPIHLAGDRGVFGNTYKPVELPFEPRAVASPSPPEWSAGFEPRCGASSLRWGGSRGGEAPPRTTQPAGSEAA